MADETSCQRRRVLGNARCVVAQKTITFDDWCKELPCSRPNKSDLVVIRRTWKLWKGWAQMEHSSLASPIYVLMPHAIPPVYRLFLPPILCESCPPNPAFRSMRGHGSVLSVALHLLCGALPVRACSCGFFNVVCSAPLSPATLLPLWVSPVRLPVPLPLKKVRTKAVIRIRTSKSRDLVYGYRPWERPHTAPPYCPQEKPNGCPKCEAGMGSHS